MSCKLIKIEQPLLNKKLPSIPEVIKKEIAKTGVVITPDMKIALAVGSRGITNLPIIVKTVIEELIQRGAKPFIVPAMGSHGGATAEGQQNVLAGLGITEKSMGVPIKSSMRVKSFDAVNGTPVMMDYHAWKADGIILINRIKPHTDFKGTYESGLVKMCVVGLGKHKQASIVHQAGINGLKKMIPEIAQKILSCKKILFGLAIVEDSYHQTACINALSPELILKKEPTLLKKAYRLMPSLPVRDIDILLVDFMGKDISGTGMDPNIIGRLRIIGQREPLSPRIGIIIVNDLSKASHGNAIGVGLADFITKKLYKKIDHATTYANVCTSTFLERAKIPLIANTVKEAFDMAKKTLPMCGKGSERIVRIKNTNELSQLYVSSSLVRELSNQVRKNIHKTEVFNSRGDLNSF